MRGRSNKQKGKFDLSVLELVGGSHKETGCMYHCHQSEPPVTGNNQEQVECQPFESPLSCKVAPHIPSQSSLCPSAHLPGNVSASTPK